MLFYNYANTKERALHVLFKTPTGFPGHELCQVGCTSSPMRVHDVFVVQMQKSYV